MICVVGRWKSKLTRAVGHAGAMAGSGDRAENKEVWFQEALGVAGVFTSENPVASARGALVTNIADIPAALTAVMRLSKTPDVKGLAGFGISHETVRSWAENFGRIYANKIRRRAPKFGDKWHLDEVVTAISGTKHWLWRAVDAEGFVLDALVQSRRDHRAAENLLRKLIRKQARAPRVMVTDKFGS